MREGIQSERKNDGERENMNKESGKEREENTKTE